MFLELELIKWGRWENRHNLTTHKSNEKNEKGKGIKKQYHLLSDPYRFFPSLI